MQRIIKVAILLFAIFTVSCKDEVNVDSQIVGLWRLESEMVDGVVTDRTTDYQINLLIEPNGIYRNNNFKSLTDVKNTFGTWHITDNTWVEFTADTWRLQDAALSSSNVSDQWLLIHVPFRFTALTLSNETMELRMKCFDAEVNYSSIFTIPVIPLVDNNNITNIQNEYKTLRTYVFKFKKVNY